MIIPATLVFFIPAALLLLVIPGPSVLYISTTSARSGRREGVKTVIGVEFGGLTHALFAAAGLSLILLESSLAFDIVKFLGAGYLFYLGVRLLISRGDNHPEAKSPLENTRGTNSFVNGYLVDLLNPKVALFFYAFLPQFVVPADGSIPLQIIFFGLVFAALGACTDSMYALFSSSIGNFLSRRLGGLRKRFKFFTAGIYIALGIVAATSNSRSTW